MQRYFTCNRYYRLKLGEFNSGLQFNADHDTGNLLKQHTQFYCSKLKDNEKCRLHVLGRILEEFRSNNTKRSDGAKIR